MKYTKFFLWALLALALCLPARAQDEAPEPDEKRRWEVGIDLLPLINKETLPAASVFGRYHFTTPAGREMALRLRVGGSTALEDSSNLPIVANAKPDKFRNVNRYQIQVRPGIQWRREVYARTYVHYGADVFILYARTDLERENRPTVFVISKETAWTFGMAGFLGLTYQINPSLSLSTEAFLNGFHQIRNLEDEVGDPATGPGTGGVGGYDITQTRFTISPIGVLNFSYHF
jgi:hypothetical protein